MAYINLGGFAPVGAPGHAALTLADMDRRTAELLDERLAVIQALVDGIRKEVRFRPEAFYETRSEALAAVRRLREDIVARPPSQTKQRVPATACGLIRSARGSVVRVELRGRRRRSAA